MPRKILPRRLSALALIGLLWPLQAFALSLPDCAGPVAMAKAQIIRVEPDGALILSDGRTVLLAGVRLPGADRPGSPVAAAALAKLRGLAMARPVTLAAVQPREDRYGRLRVQAFGTEWLQTALLKQGLARVAVLPDRGECSAEFYQAETEARRAGRGIWALPEFAVRQAQGFSAPAGSFQVIEGQVANVGVSQGRVFLDFNADYRQGFSAMIASEDKKAFRGSEPALRDLAGHVIRLRGLVEYVSGRPEIALASPKQVELLN
jgi:endonuclease YncB( thermonuclease family)